MTKLLKGKKELKKLPGHSDDEKLRVAVAAYHLAEIRGFEPGHELADWVKAEEMLKPQP